MCCACHAPNDRVHKQHRVNMTERVAHAEGQQRAAPCHLAAPLRTHTCPCQPATYLKYSAATCSAE